MINKEMHEILHEKMPIYNDEKILVREDFSRQEIEITIRSVQGGYSHTRSIPFTKIDDDYFVTDTINKMNSALKEIRTFL